MTCHDNLGSIPNQSSRLDAGFGIHIKPINSTMGWIEVTKAFKFIQKQRFMGTEILTKSIPLVLGALG
jgi:hypothetical protein